jgi:hypothetical protein
MIWSNWDVTELKAAAQTIQEQGLFTIDFKGIA